MESYRFHRSFFSYETERKNILISINQLTDIIHLNYHEISNFNDKQENQILKKKKKNKRPYMTI